MTVAVTITDIAKRFGSTEVLHDVSLDIAPGELVALLGPSGSGKTTLLRLIAGLEDADAGTVQFDGVDTRRLPLRERRIGFVFQNYALFRHMRVFDNVAYGLRARPRAERPPSAEIRRRVEELLELVQLPGLSGRFPAQLSGGQRQRVALARALAIEPSVLLLDEPFGALDAQVRKDLREWLRDVHRRTGHTTVFVTHDQHEALELADRIAVLNGGRVEQVGPPDDLYDRPLTPFVCEFLGHSIVLPVEFDQGRVLFRGTPLLDLVAPETARRGMLYARPHGVRLTDGEGLPGAVEAVRRLGHERHAAIAIAGLERPIDVALEGELPAVGQEVRLAVTEASVFALGAGDGRVHLSGGEPLQVRPLAPPQEIRHESPREMARWHGFRW